MSAITAKAVRPEPLEWFPLNADQFRLDSAFGAKIQGRGRGQDWNPIVAPEERDTSAQGQPELPLDHSSSLCRKVLFDEGIFSSARSACIIAWL